MNCYATVLPRCFRTTSLPVLHIASLTEPASPGRQPYASSPCLNPTAAAAILHMRVTKQWLLCSPTCILIKPFDREIRGMSDGNCDDADAADCEI
ncbi:hypothetical protein Trydic_g16671 [Trypoxylus dichotomus]